VPTNTPSAGRTAGLTALVLVVLIGVLSIRIADPWRYLHDDNGRRYSSYARTHLVRGLDETRGLDFFYDARDGRMVPYGHHPPGLGLLLAGWFHLTGHDSPAAARTLAVLFHLVTAAILLLILRTHYPGPAGLVAALVFALVPMSSFFGKLVNFEPFVLPLMLGAVAAYWRWAERGGDGFLVATFVLVAAGTFIDWPILLATLVIAGDALRRWRAGEGRRFRTAALAVVATGLVVGIAVAAWTSSAVGLHEIGRAARYRLRLHGHYRWWQLVGKLVDYDRRYFTEPVLIAQVVVACVLVADRWRGRRLSARERLLVLLGLAGLVPVVAFPSSARHHPYWQFYLLPYATLAVAHVIDTIVSRLPASRRRLVCAAVLLWVAVSSGSTLHTRYSRPSSYVARMVRQFQHYL
jgi:4-amino-4-deoxy-L-arabinose transferase-like glycosyltransferase